MSVVKNLAKALRDFGADGGNLVDHIHNDPLLPQNEADYVRKYFDPDLRKIIWAGSRLEGGLIALSNAASNLKGAFQRRFLTTGQFPMMTAYHATKSAEVAALIVAGGFNPAAETLYGNGLYFFNNRGRAEDYARAQGNGFILEVTIFSGISVGNPNGLGQDVLALQTNATGNMYLVKNSLTVFPKAVFAP